MVRENCNLVKEDAQILKPSSPSSPSPPPPAPAAIAPNSVSLKPSEELSSQDENRSETANPAVAATPLDKGKIPQQEEKSQTPVLFINRCSRCQKRVGLTGFRCRCGDLFCCRHRYSDAHDCSFDYKAIGREEISKANPLVRAAKIIKI